MHRDGCRRRYSSAPGWMHSRLHRAGDKGKESAYALHHAVLNVVFTWDEAPAGEATTICEIQGVSVFPSGVVRRTASTMFTYTHIPLVFW